MATQVNTVTGPISSDDLGKTLMHEHFAFGYPGFQGDTLGEAYAARCTGEAPGWAVPL